MARSHVLNLFCALSLFTSCASIKPLGQDTTENLSRLNNSDNDTDLNSTELDKLEGSVEVAVESSETHDSSKVKDLEPDIAKLKKAEIEIIETYERNDLIKEDPVSSVAEGEPEFHLDYKKKHYKFWSNYFLNRERARFTRHVKNGLKFKAVVDQVFEEEGLPKDLFFVGLIESGYNTHIRSHASAVGPWQFIKGTAKRYGLTVNGQLDERRNIFKATRAAANYFKDLYNIFGSWELALCAYNAGEYRIINAIRRGNTRDYKALVSKKLLPKETIFYIPKVAAARSIFNKYYRSESTPKEAKIYDDASGIEIDESFSLKAAAKKLGVSQSRLKTLNPDIRRDYVGKYRKGFTLYVPKSVAKVAEKKVEALPSRKSYRRVASVTKVHKVIRGESLYRIARKYNTTIASLKNINNLRRNKIFIGQKLKVRGYSKPNTYVVKRGDNLSEIADQYGMSIRGLKRLNDLRSSRLLIGQKLKVAMDKVKIYVVRNGDSLYRIARRFGLSVNKIVRANSLKEKTIYPNQKIILPI